MGRVWIWVAEEVGEGNGWERISIGLVCLVNFDHVCCLLDELLEMKRSERIDSKVACRAR